MSVITGSELGYTYQPGTTKGDDPKLRGSPDNSLFSRHEIHEVLYLLNKFCEKHSLNKASALKAERMIHTGLPSTTHSQTKVVDWLEANWNSYT
ncbi:hypothetical protein [Pseudomonas frederiksbergensis]|uniref:hypothetical protein n=1 Tax=Pseudomonas frederiksbergensis TaxID=104087 RepID=UPI003D193BF0